MRLAVVILISLLVASCAPKKFTEKPMQDFDGGGKYTYDITPEGLIVYTQASQYQFMPDTAALVEECKSIVSDAKLALEREHELKLENDTKDRIRISTAYNGITGINTCSAKGIYAYAKDSGGDIAQSDLVGIQYPFARGPANPDAVAILVGNKTYKHKDVPEVRFAYNDVEAMRQFLVKAMGYDPDNVIVVKDGTKAALDAYFGTKTNPQGRLADKIRPGASDVFVYYSGHGVPGPDGGGYLLPVDGLPEKTELSAYDTRVLIDNLNKSHARSAVVMMDTCFSGLSDAGAVVKNASPVFIKAALPTKLSKGVILSAAGGDQIASWDANAKLGLFTRYFLEGAAGAADQLGNRDMKISLDEITQYLREEVTYQARSQYGRRQVPEISGETNAADLIAVTNTNFPGMDPKNLY